MRDRERVAIVAIVACGSVDWRMANGKRDCAFHYDIVRLRPRCFRAKCGHWSFTPKTPNIVCNKFN